MGIIKTVNMDFPLIMTRRVNRETHGFTLRVGFLSHGNMSVVVANHILQLFRTFIMAKLTVPQHLVTSLGEQSYKPLLAKDQTVDQPPPYT